MAAHSSRLAELATTIAENTRKIDDYLAKHGLPQPAADAHAPADFPAPANDVEIQAARRAVMLAADELHYLMVGPKEAIRWASWGYIDNVSLQAIYHFNVAQAVPVDGEASFAAIAAAAGADEDQLRRLIRQAMTRRIFCEPREGFVAHTAASRALRDDGQLFAWLGITLCEFFKAAAFTVDAMAQHPGSQEAAQAGFPVAYGLDTPMFVEMGKHPERAKRFGAAMTSLSTGDGYTVDLLVNGYPWEQLGKATIVDVGGSHGFVCVALAKKYPDLQFVVQDLPKFVADGPSKIPPEFASRIQFQAHDFFTEQPVKDADVYFFRWIFHNWSDKYSVKILKALIPALKPGARVVINDSCLPQRNKVDLWDEHITRTMDILMLTLLHAKDRDEAEWEALFREADPQYKFLGAKQPQGSRMHVIEAIWEPVTANGGPAGV